MRTALTTATACVFSVLLAGCGSDEGGGFFDPENRRIKEIAGVEYYDGFQGEHYTRHSVYRFFYDDQGRLDRWTGSNGSNEWELEFYYESDTRICLYGKTDNEYSGTTTIYTEIDLDASGKALRFTTEYDREATCTYSNGLPSFCRYDGDGSSLVDTKQLTWTNGDLTRIDYTGDPYNGNRQEAAYNTVPNIANLDLNYLAYSTNVFQGDRVEQTLQIAGMLGRNAHFVTLNTHEPDDSGVIGKIEWTFDAAGYPTGWKSLYRDLGSSLKDEGWEYTIYYE